MSNNAPVAEAVDPVEGPAGRVVDMTSVVNAAAPPSIDLPGDDVPDELAARDGQVTVAVSPVGTLAEPSPRYGRLLEILPGLVTYVLLLVPILLSFRVPQLVAWFVITFDFYWLYKATSMAFAVSVAYARIRDTVAIDWTDRLEGLADARAREHVLGARLAAVDERVAALAASGQRMAARGGRRVAKQFREELAELARSRRDGVTPVDPRTLVHVALIPTYTETYEKLEATVRALAEADWPTERKLVAIITRETDHGGRENVARLRALFGDRFGRFFHILDPLEPGIVVGKSSAMAYGGRWLYRTLGELGYDPELVIVTDLDSDFRVHPSYFAYLAYRYATEPERRHRLFQPVPMFHNNLWDVPLPARLIAISGTHVQMWRSLHPERLVSLSSYAVCLQTAHEIGYWATDAIPEDSRFYWRSFFHYHGDFAAVPLFIPIYGDAVRARSYGRTLVAQYLQIRRWAWGVTDIPYYVHQALRHPEIPLRQRVRRLGDLWFDHINWAIAPFVLVFGASLPLLLNPDFRETTLGQNLPYYGALLLTGAFCMLLILIEIETRLAPPRPDSFGRFRRLAAYGEMLFAPIVGIFFGNLPALDAQTRLMAGRYLEYRVTEKA
ncbi:MAG: glycosyltransferase family 2 protein [Chloroflexi bacterium]|nr:glycosyltransferase family 2 protein [Chloroflexota bacterium]